MWGLQAGLPGAGLAHLCQLRIHRRASKISVSNGKFFGFALRDEKGRQIALPGRRLGSARDTYSFICNGNKAKVLGSGGNGMVFAATTSSGETVAIKKVRARLGMVNFKTWVPVNDVSGVTNLKDLIRVGTDMYLVTEQSTAAYVDCFDYQSFNMPLSHNVIRKWILQVAVVEEKQFMKQYNKFSRHIFILFIIILIHCIFYQHRFHENFDFHNYFECQFRSSTKCTDEV